MSSAHPAQALAQGTVVAGRYRVERQLGQGGMGSVFLVQHVHTDERLAMKLLHSTVVNDAATLDRFRREARTPARIDSDHVVRVTDADVAPELDNVPYLVMEYLRGEDMEQLAKRRGAIPPEEVVVLLAQAARALDKAHSLGIVHRDLKPENIFVTQREDGTPCVKILDYGIAKMTGGGDLQEAGRLTATGQIFGTPLYMSPEQARAESENICPQTDVWALGLIAHRLLTGKEYWTAQTLTHLVAQIAYEPMPPPSELGCTLGPAYDEWFARCVNREIRSRFRTAGEAASALAAALRVTDAPSQIARIPVSVRIATSDVAMRASDVLAATSASEAVTGPSNPPGSLPPAGSALGAGTQRPLRSWSAGLLVGGLLAVLVGGLLAWKVTSPPGPVAVAPATGARALDPAGAGQPSAVATPVVTPSAEVGGEISVTTEPPPPTGSIPSATAPIKVPVPGTSVTIKPTVAPPKPSAGAPTTGAPTTTPPAASSPAEVPPAPTKDPLGSRR